MSAWIASVRAMYQIWRKVLTCKLSDESEHVCHQVSRSYLEASRYKLTCPPKGYISIFPFLLGLLSPSSPHLGPILKAVRDPEQLWSDFGLRSLSKSHPDFGQGENYWRGPIWIPLNYLALQSLYNVSLDPRFLSCPSGSRRKP